MRDPSGLLATYRRFFDGAPADLDPVDFVHRTARSTPAYADFLVRHGIEPESVDSLERFSALPLTDKPTYLRQYPLPDLCRDGRLDSCDIVSVSSGSTGPPTVWPRSPVDEISAARRFEQILRQFEADTRSTLVVVCFPLGTWVGGLFTTACVRLLAAKGFPIITVAPGNNPAEILRIVPQLSDQVDQVVLMGYPPFVKSVIDAGEGWDRTPVKLVLAGEVFSEDWRSLVAERAGIADAGRDIVSMYGTADAGVLANETTRSVAIRRALADRPELGRELFGGSHLPTLMQYDPEQRYLELTPEKTLVLTTDGGVPLVRYHLGDDGGLLTFERMADFCERHGIELGAGPELPFVYVFGRSIFTVSYYGANVFPENVAPGLEQPEIADRVTGRFVMQTREDDDLDRRLHIVVELAPGRDADARLVAESIRAQLVRFNSEFAHYVPAERQTPTVTLRPAGDPEWFPVGVKHRYTRPAKET